MNLRPYMMLVGLLTFGCTAYALNPVPGPYAGILVGGTYEPRTSFVFTNPRTYATEQGTLGFSGLVGLDMHLGYRICDSFRLELQALYNKNPYSYLRLGNTTIHNHDTSTGLRIDGGTTSGTGFFNAYYDYLGDGASNTVPYAGFGIGYAYISNAVKFYENEVLVVPRQSKVSIRPAGQLILGVSRYLDDFTSFSIDVRGYGTTTEQFKAPKQIPYNFNLRIASINFIFNGAFDLG